MTDKNKSIWGVLVTPIVIAIVGAVSTYLLQDQQQKLAGELVIEERKIAVDLASKDRENALSISIAGMNTEERLQARKFNYDQIKYEKEYRANLLVEFRSDLLSCEDNRRINSLVLISHIDAGLSKSISSYLVECSSKSIPLNTIKTIEKKSGFVKIKLKSVLAEEDGEIGNADWYFRLLIDGKEKGISKSFSISDSNGEKVINHDFDAVSVVDGMEYSYEIEAVRATGKEKGVKAVGNSVKKITNLDNKGTSKYDQHIVVPGFPTEGDFIVKIEIEYL